MPALPLDDKRWGALWSSEGPARTRPEMIQYRLDHPEKVEPFGLLASAVCSDGTTWSSGFAAMPYIVQMAKKLPAEKRSHIFAGVGWIVTAAAQEQEDPHAQLEPYLAESYQQAVNDCLPLLAETLQCEQSDREMVDLFFAAAALKGHPHVAATLANLDSCEHCNEMLGWR